MKPGLRAFLLAGLAGFVSLPAGAASCETLNSLELPNTIFSVSKIVPAGAWALPAAQGPSAMDSYNDLPAFCRVAAALGPTRRSDIKIEVWMPVTGWNGKLQAIGNGRWAGRISYREMSDALCLGYAAASTDTSHTPKEKYAVTHRIVLCDARNFDCKELSK
jgi:tannase/feruloyl esterase